MNTNKPQNEKQNVTPKPTRTRDARGRWQKLPSASAEALPPASPQNPIQLPRLPSRPPEPPAAPPAAPPARADQPIPFALCSPGAKATPKRKRARAPRQCPTPTPEITLGGVRYRPKSDENPWSNDDGGLLRTPAGQWYFLRDGVLNDEPAPRDVEPLTPAGVIALLLRSNLEADFLGDFAAYLSSIFPAAPGAGNLPTGFREMAADFAMPPEVLANLFCSAAISRNPQELRIIRRPANGPRDASPLAEAPSPAPTHSAHAPRSPDDPSAAPAGIVPSPHPAPWRFDLLLSEPLNSLFRAMLTDDQQTPEEWVQEEAVSAVKAWLSIPDLGERLESRFAAAA